MKTKTYKNNVAPQIHQGTFTAIDWSVKYNKSNQVAQSSSCASEPYISMASAIEASYNIKFNTSISISPQSLLDCNGGCSSFTDFVDNYQNAGITGVFQSSSYPWAGTAGTCKNTTVSGTAIRPYEMSVMFPWASTPISAQQKINVLQHGPYVYFSAITLPKSYSTGPYVPTSGGKSTCGSYYYPLVVVGYGVGSNSQDYWIIKTHLGSSWGLPGGFLYLGRNDTLVNFGASCSYAQARFD